MYYHHIPGLKFHLKLASYLYSTPYIWDEGSGSLRVKTGRIFHSLLRVDHVVSASYATFQALQFLGTYPLQEKLLMFVFSLMFWVSFAIRWEWGLSSQDDPLINAMLRYDKLAKGNAPSAIFSCYRFGFSGKVKKSMALKLSIVAGQLSTVSCVVFPLIIFYIVYTSPCTPPFLGSFIIPKMLGDCSSVPVQVKLSFATVEWTLYSMQIYPAAVKGVWFLLAGIVYLLDHLNAVHLNPKKLDWAKRYKYLQILAGLINCSMKHVTTVVLFAIALVQLYAAFVCIKFRNAVTWPSFGIFPLLMIDTFVGNFICSSVGGKVFGNSKKMIAARGKEVVRGKPGKLMKYRLLQLKACPELRVAFGENDFIEETTPLTIQGFAWSSFVNLLVMFEQS